MLNRFYQWLLKFKNQDDLRDEMLDTFEEGRREARARGMLAYVRFACRETMGVLGQSGTPARKRAWVTVAGLTLAGFVAGTAVGLFGPASYTSEAALVIMPAAVSFAPADEIPLHFGWIQGAILPQLLSRTQLTNIIHKFRLYPNLRIGYPMEDVIEHMRKSIRIESSRNGIVVSFTLSDWTLLRPSSQFGARNTRTEMRFTTQKVTQELVARIIDEAIRQRIHQSVWTPDYLEERSEKVGREWEKLAGQLQSVAENDPRAERLRLDRDLARKDYEALRQRLSEARVVEDLGVRRKGAALELLDPASLPMQPDFPEGMPILLGMGAGFGLGWLLVFYRSFRRAAGKHLTPQVA